MTPGPHGDGAASKFIDRRIEELGDWRGERLAEVRRLIHEADPDVVEEQKWKKPTNPDGVPVWSHDGILCTGESYRTNVRLTFAKGALLKDPKGLFNASLKGNSLRAIVIREGERIDAAAFKSLIRAAVELNESVAAARRK